MTARRDQQNEQSIVPQIVGVRPARLFRRALAHLLMPMPYCPTSLRSTFAALLCNQIADALNREG